MNRIYCYIVLYVVLNMSVPYNTFVQSIQLISRQKQSKTTITTLNELSYYQTVQSYKNIKVIGDTANIPSNHPVMQAVMNRWKENSKPGKRKDPHKIALAIEGGGMRGCVSAGATAALNFLGLNDAIDIVYGSSAGAMIGAYFISRQSSGIEIYYDYLPAAGRKFIKKSNLLHAVFSPNVISYRDKTVFNLDFLLNDVMGNLMALDWETFISNERNQPLRMVASSLDSLSTVILSKDNNNYNNLDSLLECIRVSMAVPGITGDLFGIHKQSNQPAVIPYHLPKKWLGSKRLEVMKNNIFNNPIIKSYHNVNDYLPLVDAFLCEPIPYRSACDEGATHVIALRTKPDPCQVLGVEPGIFETTIAKKFFMKYNHYNAVDWILDMEHIRIYAEDIIRLNEASKGPTEGIIYNNRSTHILPIACQSSREINQLENNRNNILTGVKDGAKRVLDIFLPSILDSNISSNEMEAIKYNILEMLFPLKDENGNIIGFDSKKVTINEFSKFGLQKGEHN